MGNGPPETGRGAGRRSARRSACCSLRGCCRVQGSGVLPQPTQRLGAEPRAGLGQRAGLALGCLPQVPWVQGPELQQELSPDPQPSGEGWFLSWGLERCCPCTPALMLGPSAPHPHPASAMLSLLPCSAPSPPHRRPCSPRLSHTCPCIPWPRSTSTTASRGPDLVPCASPLLHRARQRSPAAPAAPAAPLTHAILLLLGGQPGGHGRLCSAPRGPGAAAGSSRPAPRVTCASSVCANLRFLNAQLGAAGPGQRPCTPTGHRHGARCPHAARGAMGLPGVPWGCLPRPCCSTQSPPAEHCPWQ